MPYIVGHPVQNPSDFYGRERQVSQLFKIIGGPQAQSVIVTGLNRAGKTSFLHHIAHPAVMVRYLRHPENVVMVYIDMASCKTPAHFYYRLQTQLKMKMGQVNTGFLWKDSVPDEMSIYDVEAYLCHYPNRRIVILLDAFDELNTDTFGRHFFTELRAMTSVTDYDLSCVVASSTNLYLLGGQVGLPMTSPFYNVFFPVPIYLGDLETAVVDSLICQPAIQSGIPFSASELHQIKQLAGTMPFLVQAVAARWLYLKQQTQLPDQKAILMHLVAELKPFFEKWWLSFDQCQQQLLGNLAQNISHHALPFNHFTIEEAEKRLRNLGIIVEKRGQVTINGLLFTIWLSQHMNLKIEAGPQLNQQGSDISASIV